MLKQMILQYRQKQREKALRAAAAKGNLYKAQKLLDQDTNVNATDQRSMTALMLACTSGQIEVVKFLLQRGANLSMKTTDGKSALTFARKLHSRDKAIQLHKLMISSLAHAGDKDALKLAIGLKLGNGLNQFFSYIELKTYDSQSSQVSVLSE